MRLQRESGQAVLVVLLVMAVVLTTVLSVLGTSTSDIRISSNEAESQRAFSAAESGIERALVTNSSSTGSVGNANFNASVTSLAQGTRFFNYPSNLVNGDIAMLWYVAHDNNGLFVCNATNPCFTGRTVKVCWGRPGTAASAATTPAVDVTTYYLVTPGNYGTVRTAKAIYDPNTGRNSTNSYSPSDSGSCTIDNINYAFGKTIDLGTLGIVAGTYNSQNGLQFSSVRMLYNTNQDHPIGFDLNFSGNSVIPSQGQLVNSTGSLNRSTRRIEVASPYVGFPQIMDTAIFAPTGIAQ